MGTSKNIHSIVRKGSRDFELCRIKFNLDENSYRHSSLVQDGTSRLLIWGCQRSSFVLICFVGCGWRLFPCMLWEGWEFARFLCVPASKCWRCVGSCKRQNSWVPHSETRYMLFAGLLDSNMYVLVKPRLIVRI